MFLVAHGMSFLPQSLSQLADLIDTDASWFPLYTAAPFPPPVGAQGMSLPRLHAWVEQEPDYIKSYIEQIPYFLP